MNVLRAALTKKKLALVRLICDVTLLSETYLF